MERFYFLGDSERYNFNRTDKCDRVSLVSGYSLNHFLKKNSRVSFDLLILDGLAGAEEIRRQLAYLEKEANLPPVILAAVSPSSLPDSLTDHYLLKGIYDGPLILSDLFRECRKILSRAAPEPPLFEGMTDYCGIVGKSPAVKDVWAKIDKYAGSIDRPVLICGESGTGKELVARALYERGHEKSSPFIPYQASVSEDHLMASDLFGVRKGAYTGSENRRGLLSLARGGVFFLDEIGLLSSGNQRMLLRALQEMRIRPLGSPAEEDVDFRLISATNEDLGKAVDEARFRSDLFHRINTLRILVPPLRERREDVLLLAEHFLREDGKDKRFTEGAGGEVAAL